ncbi:MAG: host specificity factor TipJ family phage tail protein [Pseudomonadota bacterium]
MKAQVVILRNPLDPVMGRELRLLRRPQRIRALAPTGAPWGYYALLNGKPILRRAWRRRMRDGETLVFVPVLANNGGGGSNPLRLILSLALMAFAPWAAGQLLGSAAGNVLFGSFTLGQATALGITLVGQALIGALLPMPQPFNAPQASPTYTLQAQGNAARLEQPVPVQYGRIKCYPDFAEQPYTEFASNEQYLNHLLCLGVGEFDVEQILIEDTPITNFGEVETEIIPPGAAVTLFPTSVVTAPEVSGIELVGTRSGTWTRSGSTVTMTETAHGRLIGSVVYAELPWAPPAPGSYTITNLGGGNYSVTTVSGVGAGTFTGSWRDPSEDHGGRTRSFSGTWSRSGTTVSMVVTGGDFAPPGNQQVSLSFINTVGPSGVYAITATPTADTFTFTESAGSGSSGTAKIATVAGGLTGYVASAAGAVATYLAVDIGLPAGLFASNSDGLTDLTVEVAVQGRLIDDVGLPLGDWISLGSHQITARTVDAIRQTYRYPLATPGRYQVRVWRGNPVAGGTSSSDTVYFGGLRAYLRQPTDYGNVTLLAVRMKASNNLQGQASRRVAVIATRKIPVWTGSAWSAPQPSQSIAWAIADAARAADYGADLADAEINLASLLALDAIWTARGDTFNARFDTSASWWDQVSRIAAAGRAKTYLQGGILQISRDGPASVPVAMFSMHNMVQGSFSIDMLAVTADTADAVELAFWDARVWGPNRVTARLPGSTAARPVKSEGFGIDNAAQAMREGMYRAASNRFHRRIVRFETEMDGFIPSFGELITIQHDTVGWGQSAEVLDWDAETLTAWVSEPLIWTDGATHYAGLRRRNGTPSGPWIVTRGAGDDMLVFATLPDVTPDTGSDRDRSHIAFGPGQAWSALAKVASLRPRTSRRVEIEAVIYDPSVHTAEDGVVAPPVNPSSLPRLPTRPVVADLRARTMPGDSTRGVFSWQPAPGAEIYHFEMAEGADPADPTVVWTRIADTSASGLAATLLFSTRTMVRVRGVGMTAGRWKAATLGTLISAMWNTSSATAMWTTDPTLMWRVS